MWAVDRLGRLPARIAVLGCEPEPVQVPRNALSEPVARSLGRAEALALRWVDAVTGGGGGV